jgi:hypothetical protein
MWASSYVFAKERQQLPKSLEDFSTERLIHNTHRLGNLIDAWYFGSLGKPLSIREFHILCNLQKKGSFGEFLKKSFPVTSGLDKSTQKHLFLQDNRKARWPQQKNEYFPWSIYAYRNIQLVHKDLQKLLKNCLFQFAGLDKGHSMVSSVDTVVHYRLGDFISLGFCIDPKSVAEAVGSLYENKLEHTTIGIVDGGALHKASQHDINLGQKIKTYLKKQLQKQLPHASIRDCGGASADADFFLCATAPRLVTAGGSFAVCAAVANTGLVATPACQNLNFCSQSIPCGNIRKGWSTYSYEPFDPGSLEDS